MANIIFPPRGESTPPTTTALNPCCTLDASTLQSMLDYGLGLLLNKVSAPGGPDFTDCATVVAQYRQSGDVDVNHIGLVELQSLIDLLAANGITVTADQLRAGGACIRSNLPLGALQGLQFFLWNLVVNELTP